MEHDATTAPATDAGAYNKDTYDRIWPQMSDFIRYNPGARHRRRLVFELLDDVPFERLLDVGCGNAELLRLIDARYPGRHLMGVDLSDVVVADNSRQFRHMRFATCDIEQQDLPRGHDAIVCCEVLEHLADPGAALKRIFKALDPGGVAIITTPTGKVHATEKHFGHVRHPTPRELRLMAEDAGFLVDEILVWGFPFYAFTKWATNLNPEAALERFAGPKPYGVVEKAVSEGLTLVNRFNLTKSPFGVQLVARFRKP